MSSLRNRLAEIAVSLATARDGLLAAIADAAGEEDWSAPVRLVELAQHTDTVRKGVLALTGGRALGSARAANGSGNAQGKLATKTPRSATYPRFLVRDGLLVKQGLQRNGRDVYEHGVPRKQLDQILESVGGMAQGRKGTRHEPFSMEAVQDKLDERGGLPRYMTYVVMSFLRERGLLDRLRKGAYVFTDSARFATAAGQLWQDLQKESVS